MPYTRKNTIHVTSFVSSIKRPSANRMINAMPQEQKAMQIRMRSMTPVWIEGDIYQVTANNSQIAQNLNNMMTGILSTMRQNLKNSKFTINVRIAEAQEIKRMISKPEMFKAFMEQNSGISMLHKMLHLELI